MPTAEWVAIITLFLSIIGSVVVVTVYVTGLKTDFTEKIALVRESHGKEIMSVRDVFSMSLEKEVARQDDQRHKDAGHAAALIAGLSLELERLRTKFDTVVHKEDLHAMESRIAAQIDGLSRNLSTQVDKLERRLESNSGAC